MQRRWLVKLIKQEVINLNPRGLTSESAYLSTVLNILFMMLAKIIIIIALEVTRT